MFYEPTPWNEFSEKQKNIAKRDFNSFTSNMPAIDALRLLADMVKELDKRVTDLECAAKERKDDHI